MATLEQWFICPTCDGEGVVPTGLMSHAVDSATIDPPFEVTEKCRECNGAGGWIGEAEPDPISEIFSNDGQSPQR